MSPQLAELHSSVVTEVTLVDQGTLIDVPILLVPLCDPGSGEPGCTIPTLVGLVTKVGVHVVQK